MFRKLGEMTLHAEVTERKTERVIIGKANRRSNEVTKNSYYLHSVIKQNDILIWVYES